MSCESQKPGKVHPSVEEIRRQFSAADSVRRVKKMSAREIEEEWDRETSKVAGDKNTAWISKALKRKTSALAKS